LATFAIPVLGAALSKPAGQSAVFVATPLPGVKALLPWRLVEAGLLTLFASLWFDSIGSGGWWLLFLLVGALATIPTWLPPRFVPVATDPRILVDASSRDDAAVFQLAPDRAIVATVDFFTPIVDDPYDFGRIAATNAFSDLYAMGATPLFALNLVGWPRDTLP